MATLPGQETPNRSPTLFAPHPCIATVIGLEKSFQREEKKQDVNIDVLVISLQAVISPMTRKKQDSPEGWAKRYKNTNMQDLVKRSCKQNRGVNPWSKQSICSKTESGLWKAFTDQYELPLCKGRGPQTTSRVVSRIQGNTYPMQSSSRSRKLGFQRSCLLRQWRLPHSKGSFWIGTCNFSPCLKLANLALSLLSRRKWLQHGPVASCHGLAVTYRECGAEFQIYPEVN